jgi:RNA recognition motif-containing protein
MMQIYVKAISREASDRDLFELFSKFGEVTAVLRLFDKATGKPRGLGFITMREREAGLRAIRDLHLTRWRGRDLKLEEARPLPGRPR